MAATLRPDQTIRVDRALLGAAAAARKGSLLVISGTPADIGVHLVIEDRVVIGREAEGLQLRDGRISRRHVEVERRDGGFVVRDLGSTNGTLLNGERITGDLVLSDGDKIYLGRSVVKFTLVDETEVNYLSRIARLASTDELTGLVAKHRFDSLLHEAFRVARAGNTPLCLLMMDMDGLKRINDTHGHQMGAHTIGQVGALLGEIIGEQGESCRFGGDEFCAFVSGLTLEKAMEVGEQIRRAVRQRDYTLNDKTVRATISIGVAELSSAVSSAEQLLELADRALYRAKAAGRDAVCI